MSENVQSPDSNIARSLKSPDKIFIAFFAGVAPIATKYLARDQGTPLSELMEIYITTGVCLFFLAAGICYLSKETDRMKLFMLAVSAPALISNMSAETSVGGLSTTPNDRAFIYNPLVTSAVAADHSGNNFQIIKVGFTKNIKSYFGVNTEENTSNEKYWVIVLSTRDKQYAEEIAAKINAINPSLMAFVGNRRPNNDFYPVIIGERSNRQIADELLIEGRLLSEQLPELNGRPYLDTYANRQ